MNEQIVDLFGKGFFLLGTDSEMTIKDVKILRAFLAEGYYQFNEKNKQRKSKIDDYKWLSKQADMYGINNL